MLQQFKNLELTEQRFLAFEKIPHGSEHVLYGEPIVSRAVSASSYDTSHTLMQMTSMTFSNLWKLGILVTVLTWFSLAKN